MKRTVASNRCVVFFAIGLGLMSIALILASQMKRANASTTFTVMNTADSGPGSLRQAILDANATLGADTINFDPSLTGTITLTTGQLPAITDNLTVTGPGAANLTISGNHASRVFLIADGVTVMISDLTISNGSIIGDGGGISNNGGTLTITNSTLSNNSVTGFGGGIFNDGIADRAAKLTITNSTLSNNFAGLGAGISNEFGTMTITNSTLSNNFAQEGGGIWNNGGTMTITNSTLSNNSAFTIGGGIFNAGPAMITNSTLSGNSVISVSGVGDGGGIWHNFDMLTITNSTLSNNLGGGFRNNGGTVNFKNSIVANNPSGGDCASFGIFKASGVNFSTDGSCSGFTQVTPAQLNLGPLQDNGGPTKTHALLSGSVAIDAVMDCTDVAGSPVTQDQRGVMRPMDGDSDGIAQCDVGAYEAPACSNGDSVPPSITCPANISTASSATCSLSSSSAPVSFTVTANDNCGTPTLVCIPPSGSTFPVGDTAVTCTATDSGGLTAQCTFTVSLFSFCLLDESSPGNVVFVNAQTGEFSFCCDGVPIASGRGDLTTRDCIGSIDSSKGDRQVHIQWDTSANSGLGAGTAYVQKRSNKIVCQITDRNMSNNTCQCSVAPPPVNPKKPPKEREF
jgi:hypothetical protein